MPKNRGNTKAKSTGSAGRGPMLTPTGSTGRLNGRSNLKLSASTELTRLGMNDRRTPTAISFGSPSDNGSSGSKSRSSGNDWSNLLEKTVSGGLSNLLGGGALSDGIGYLVSGISSLFGGNDPVAPLKRYTLPDSQERTFYTGSQGLMSSEANVGQGKAGSLQDAQVVQAVKKALLTSSSLNDVISEL